MKGFAARPPDADGCPVCAARDTHYHGRGRDRLFGVAGGAFRLVSCCACRCVFQQPMPSADALAAFYPSGYWWDESRHSLSGLIQRAEQAYRRFVCMDHVRFLAKCARRSHASGRRLLDIGCGSGLFMHLAQRHGFDVAGMDVSSRAGDLARTLYGLTVRAGSIGDPLWEGETFDFVTMFHVLEHLRQPDEALLYARRLLKPGGSLILQVPNVRSIQAVVFGSRWYGLDVPRHLINYSPEGLALLLRRCGFHIRRRKLFSLRDNPASIASSLAMSLDPVGRQARQNRTSPAIRVLFESMYLGLFLLCVLPAAMESALGRGGTIWIEAWPENS